MAINLLFNLEQKEGCLKEEIEYGGRYASLEKGHLIVEDFITIAMNSVEWI